MSATRGLRLRHARNELRRNRGLNAALVVMIVLSATLMGSGAVVMERLVGAIDHLLEQTQPPHFLQMHKGDYDADALTRFAATHPEIESWFVEEMVGFDGAAIAWSRPVTGAGGDFSESLIDNLFVAQSPQFDLLIDLDGGVPRPAPGEVYAPVALMTAYGLEPGDILTVTTMTGAHELTIAGFVRDGQMASSLASAVRFLVAPQDRDALTAAGGGAPEIIVEYRLTDPTLASDLERAYAADPSLPKNGEAVTFTMIRTLHAISDGIGAITLMLVAGLLVAIAVIVVRFVIAGRLEDDVHQLGVMRAIGLPAREISRLYLTRYVALTMIGCAVGGALTLATVPWLTRGARLSYGTAGAGPWTVVVLLLAIAAVALLVIASSSRMLARVRRVPVVTALVHGRLEADGSRRRWVGRVRRSSRLGLASSGRGVTRRLTLIELRADARQWALVPIVLALAALLAALPLHLLGTLGGPSVVTAMGVPPADLLIQLQDGDGLDDARTAVVGEMAADDRVSEVQVVGDTLLEVDGAHGWQGMRVEVGEGAGHGIAYTDGGPPGPGELALSVLNAAEHELRPGDTLRVRDRGKVSHLVVSGVYADVTSGGYTAKMHGEPRAAIGYTIYATVADGADPIALAAEYEARFPQAHALPMREYAAQTMAHLTGAIRTAALLAAALGVGIATVVLAMFLPLRVARERRAMGVKAAIGFSTAEIVAQLRGKVLVGVVAGTIVGSLAALVFAGPFASVLMGSAGLGPVRLPVTPSPWALALPMLLVGVVLAATLAVTTRLRGADTSRWLRD